MLHFDENSRPEWISEIKWADGVVYDYGKVVAWTLFFWFITFQLGKKYGDRPIRYFNLHNHCTWLYLIYDKDEQLNELNIPKSENTILSKYKRRNGEKANCLFAVNGFEKPIAECIITQWAQRTRDCDVFEHSFSIYSLHASYSFLMFVIEKSDG